MFTQPRTSRAATSARFRFAAGARSVAAALAVAAIPATIACTTLGVGVASAATAAKVSWHKMTLANGWTSSQSDYSSGDPAWTVLNGIVYLSGSMHQNVAGSSEVTILPPAARPAHMTYLNVYTNNDTTGRVVIYPSGLVLAGSNPSGNAVLYTSLAALSYPAAKTSLHAFALRNGWQAYQNNTGKPSYYVSGGMVYLYGALHQPAPSAATEFAVLPKADRPVHYDIWVPSCATDGPGTVRADTSGAVSAYMNDSTTFTSLDGISFQLSTAGQHPLTLINDWIASSGGTPTYSVSDGVVHLSGSIAETSEVSTLFAVLPPGARPAHEMYISVYTLDGSTGTLRIEPNGDMIAYSPVVSNASDYTSLASVSFPLGS